MVRHDTGRHSISEEEWDAALLRGEYLMIALSEGQRQSIMEAPSWDAPVWSEAEWYAATTPDDADWRPWLALVVGLVLFVGGLGLLASGVWL